MKWIYIGIGHLCVVLGIIGIFLPLMPTTPFLVLAFSCYSKGSKRFQKMLIEHPVLGPPVKDWIEKGVIRTKSKILAIAICCVSLLSIWGIFTIPEIPKYLASSIILCVIFFIYSRPSK